ncbi:MAG: hypothetical protein K6G08_04985 [Prevotella sp.]|nr:hypothetical protein [Prevotella sp.]
MKKIHLAMACLVGLAMMTSCGGKKDADKDAGKEKTEATENQDAENDEDTDEANQKGTLDTGFEVDDDPANAIWVIADSLYPDFKAAPTDIFFDNCEAETVGEFPSKWDINEGSAEVMEMGGRNIINMKAGNTELRPMVNGSTEGYLPNSYTFEFEYYCNAEGAADAFYTIQFWGNEEEGMLGEINLFTRSSVEWWLKKENDDQISGDFSDLRSIEHEGCWNHFAISFDKGNLKVFVNGKRVGNMPNIKGADHIALRGSSADDGYRYYFTNVRLKK